MQKNAAMDATGVRDRTATGPNGIASIGLTRISKADMLQSREVPGRNDERPGTGKDTGCRVVKCQPGNSADRRLFVCLGNICRSTMAEGVFRSLARSPPYDDLVGDIDSCGTGAYHVGEEPDDRTMSTLEKHGITDYVHYARKVHPSDFDKFDYIFAMDRGNLDDLQRIQRRKLGSKAKVMLFGEYSGTGKAEVISDPYYGGRQGFEKAYEQATRFSRNFLKDLFPNVQPQRQL